jgi:hypothetical protein
VTTLRASTATAERAQVKAPTRARKDPKPPISIIGACEDLFADWFRDRATFVAWFAFLRVMFGLALDEIALNLFRECTGRSVPAPGGYREVTLVIGRRGGKSLMMALIAAYLACFFDWRPFLTIGERASIMIIAADRRQATVIFKYLRGMLGVPMLESLIERETLDTIDLSNGITIEIQTASYKTVRGRTVVAVLLDELAFFSDENSANPDVEIVNALRPAMATIPGAVMIKASSPYARRGALWNDYKKHFAKDDSATLVWQADTRTMNPSVPQSFIDAAYEDDPASAAAEYGAQFRTDVESFVSREVVEACVVQGRFELPPVLNLQYVAFVDPSGGSSDSMTMAIAHREAENVVLDVIREAKPPFSPEQVVSDFCILLKGYRCGTVLGDRYAGAWPAERFQTHGITYFQNAKPKSDIYRDMLPIINGGRAELLDHPKILSQLCALERRTARGGKDSIDHPPGQHDDVVNAVAGALTNLIAAPPMRFAPPIVITKSEMGFDSNTGSVHRNPAMRSGPEYAGHDFVPHFSTKQRN